MREIFSLRKQASIEPLTNLKVTNFVFSSGVEVKDDVACNSNADGDDANQILRQSDNKLTLKVC